MLYGFCLGLLLAPFARGMELRAILFALVTMAVAWQMAVTANAGTSAHHTILLWPLPQMVMAISFANASGRLGRAAVPALAGVTAILMASGLAVTNEYYTVLNRNGAAINWTDGFNSLSRFLATAPATGVIPVDWGIMDGLRLLNRGRLPLVVVDMISKNELTGEDRRLLADRISDPNHFFVAHVKGLEFFEGLNDRMVRFAEGQGYRREMVTSISDSHNRPTFDVYRFARRQGP